jgi:hypothetical protein
MEAGRSSEALVSNHHTIWLNNPENQEFRLTKVTKKKKKITSK